jgi:hypothetical protein
MGPADAAPQSALRPDAGRQRLAISARAADVELLQLGDNIGHLSRGGRDGWGRAFCAGLQAAIDRGYDYVAHVEGDSLLRLPLLPTFETMGENRDLVGSVPVHGTRLVERNWIETGLMLFDVTWLREAKLVERYDWQNGAAKAYPRTPEWHLYQLTLPVLRMMPWSAERGDQGQIRVDNVGNYDWITHVAPAVSDEFVRSVLG